MEYIHKLIKWIKANKLAAVLLAIIGYYLYSNIGIRPIPYREDTIGYGMDTMELSAPVAGSMMKNNVADFAPISTTQDRKVITDSDVSLLVRNTQEVITGIQAKTKEFGGFVVRTNILTPLEKSTGYVVVRIPSDKLDTFLQYLDDNSLKVVSQTISGYDVTDTYVDNEARLITLRATKARYEEFFNQATDVDELLKVQQKILQVQDQIDAIVGQQKSLDVTTSTTLLTVNVSEDELALPYAPEEPWSAEAIFKLAVRSLVKTSRNIVAGGIWLAVYLPLIVIVVVGYKLGKRVFKKKAQ